MAAPTIDLSLFSQGNASQRQKLAGQLRDTLSSYGYMKLVGHGIPDWAVAEMFEWNRLFFHMNVVQKMKIVHPGGSAPQRGWSAVGAENSSTLYRKGLLKARMTEDLKDARVYLSCLGTTSKGAYAIQEHFDQGAITDVEFPNRWPDEQALPGFRKYMEEAFSIFEGVSATIMEALEVAFGLPSGAFLNRITHDANASEMRFNHYPAIDVQEIRSGGVSRIWPHFDLGVITLLFQDGVGGLEFEDRNQSGAFARVGCSDSAEMVVNVSETLQRWTNGTLGAGLHRVNVPEHLEDRETGILPERYSIAYFCKADRGASVGPLRQFVDAGTEPAYEDISAIEYHQQRLQSAY